MFGSETLEVAIGIIFVYILISIICTVIREGMEAWLKTRAAYLEYGIRELLHDKKAEGLTKNFFNHPLISGLFSGEYKPEKSPSQLAMLANGNNLPSYIPAKNFAMTLMDIAARGPDTSDVSSNANAPVISLDALRTNIANLENPAVQRVLLTAIDSAQGDLNKAQANIEAWFDSAMDRVSGWYKRATQWILFWIGLGVAVSMNINTITIADYLYRNDTARAALVARAETAVPDTAFLSRNYATVKEDLNSMSLPIGWSEGWGAPKHGKEEKATGIWNNLIAPILGWLLTAFAATLGAPFWFDLLNKIMVIRSTVKPHEKSQEEASQDRQLPAKPNAEETTKIQELPVNDDAIPAPVNNIALTLLQGSPMDAESRLDGGEGDVELITLDENLPVATGGVA